MPEGSDGLRCLMPAVSREASWRVPEVSDGTRCTTPAVSREGSRLRSESDGTRCTTPAVDGRIRGDLFHGSRRVLAKRHVMPEVCRRAMRAVARGTCRVMLEVSR